jgi:hypothetical protein
MTDESKSAAEDKPKRLYFKTYLKAINNSVGSNLFRNFYVSLTEKGEFDALGDGENSCAFFVSSVLVIFKKLKGIHGTVESTIKDLVESGWIEANQPVGGDILVWEALQYDDGFKKHIGFSIGDGKAISTSREEKTPVEHDQHFEDAKRTITHIYRMTSWD